MKLEILSENVYYTRFKLRGRHTFSGVAGLTLGANIHNLFVYSNKKSTKSEALKTLNQSTRANLRLHKASVCLHMFLYQFYAHIWNTYGFWAGNEI